MVTPLTIIMLCLAVYLIPNWQLEFVLYIPTVAEFLESGVGWYASNDFLFLSRAHVLDHGKGISGKKYSFGKIATTDTVHLAQYYSAVCDSVSSSYPV